MEGDMTVKVVYDMRCDTRKGVGRCRRWEPSDRMRRRAREVASVAVVTSSSSSDPLSKAPPSYIPVPLATKQSPDDPLSFEQM